jgi:uncharacterized protein (DUF1501 family)
MQKKPNSNIDSFDRRELLSTGIRGAFGMMAAGSILGRASVLSADDSDQKTQANNKKAITGKATAQSMIFVYLNGGPSHIDTFDLKPGAPTGGPFKALETSAKGIRISEHLPNLAKVMKHMNLINSMTSPEGSHARARHLLQSGYVPAGPVRFPGFGAVVARECCPDTFALPPYVAVGGRNLGGGYLGARYSPFVVNRPDSKVANLENAPGVDNKRLGRRRALLHDQEKDFGQGRSNKLVKGHKDTYDRAHAFMTAEKRKAFDISQEKAAIRNSYGAGRFGQSCLLARRLIEVQVPYVSINLGGWDTHRENFPKVQNLSKQLDDGLGTLIQELVERDLLKSTVIVCCGEFGRTPRINANKGRDHWPKAFSALVGGGGLADGQLIGRTDAKGALVAQNPVKPPDLIATVATRFGLNRDYIYHSDIGRPFRIIHQDAKLVKELL